jgi:HSP20 family molecular chaperone IbpA
MAKTLSNLINELSRGWGDYPGITYPYENPYEYPRTTYTLTSYPIINPSINEYFPEEKRMEYTIPGVDKKDIKLEVNGKKLTLEIDNEKYKKYNCSFDIPDDVDGDNITSTYSNGILHVQFKELNKKKIIKVQ